MNSETEFNGSAPKNSETLTDVSKLASLLALAAGATVMPQAAHADIIYTDLSASPFHVGFGSSSGDTYTFLGLPGTAGFAFHAFQHSSTTFLGGTRYYRTVTAGQVGTAEAKIQITAGGLPLLKDKDVAWNAGNFIASVYATIAWASDAGHLPNNYDHKYIGWYFADTTQGNALRYGWIELGLANGNTSASGVPDVTIYGFAWDNTGAQIAMGATNVPEPTAMSLLALGAMAFGARGVRAWRQKRKG
jgi:hypothetical protein